MIWAHHFRYLLVSYDTSYESYLRAVGVPSILVGFVMGAKEVLNITWQPPSSDAEDGDNSGSGKYKIHRNTGGSRPTESHQISVSGTK